MAGVRLADVVATSESKRPNIGWDSHAGTVNASMYLVCRMFTDAIFSQDIRTIQLIINRIDGGLPRDVDVEDYQTQFSDCLRDIMALPLGEQLKLTPDDTVMSGLCKSLYALAVQDIYVNPSTGEPCRPSADRKNERDAALRMVLERTGGRKTLVAASREVEGVEDADWIASLPSAGS